MHSVAACSASPSPLLPHASSPRPRIAWPRLYIRPSPTSALPPFPSSQSHIPIVDHQTSNFFLFLFLLLNQATRHQNSQRVMGMMARDEHRELSSEEEALAGEDDLRRGPWTVEEDLLLVNYIAAHGEGRWNALARCAGLRRTGKSCRLRWLNYLRPDVRRGNMTAQEQLVILELHARWGNRWSKIAQHLPGRTDNEIKNYWRTRVQKHAKHLNCDVNSQHFKDLMRFLWMPRLLERIQSDASNADLSSSPSPSSSSSVSTHGAGMQLVSPPPPFPAVESSDGVGGYTMCQQTNCTQSGGMMVAQQLQQQLQQQPASAASVPAASGQLGAESSSCWPESLLPGVHADYDVGFPELETMWGACADDDLWYTQMLEL